MYRTGGCSATAFFGILKPNQTKEGFIMTIADRIQTLRKQSGLFQEQLAERLDVSRQAVSKWESGVSLR